MIRWEPSDPRRMHPQEMALLALADRMTAVEQLVTLMGDTQRQMIIELRQAHEELRDTQDRLRRLEEIVASR